MSNQRFVKHDTVTPVDQLPGIQRRNLGITDTMMVCEFTLASGSVVPMHSHLHEQTGYIVSGALRLTIAGEAQDLKPGDSYAIPGDVEHQAEALEDTVLIDIFSPPRDEYR